MSQTYAYSNPIYDYCPLEASPKITEAAYRPIPKPRTSLKRRLAAEAEEAEFEEEADRMAALLNEIEAIASSFTAKLSNQCESTEAETSAEQQPRRKTLNRKRVPVASALFQMSISSISTVTEEEEDLANESPSSSSSPDFPNREPDTPPPPQLPPKRVGSAREPKFPLPPLPPPRLEPGKEEEVDQEEEEEGEKKEEEGIEKERDEEVLQGQSKSQAVVSKPPTIATFNIRFELLALDHLHNSSLKLQRVGHLWKTGPNYKAFKSRWCVLSRHSLEAGGHFAYYFNQNSMATSLSGKFPLSDVEFIGAIESVSGKTRPPKLSSGERRAIVGAQMSNSTKKTNEFSFFKLGVKNRQGRVYLFAARSHSELQLWLHGFLQTLSLHSVKNKEIYHCGFLHTRFTVTGRWQLCFSLLTTDRCLYIFEMASNSTEARRVIECQSYQIFNLRKTVRLAPFDPNGFSLTQNGGRVVYLATEFTGHVKLWREAVERFWRTPEVLEKMLLAEQYLTKDNVPVAIDKCLKFLDTFNRTGGRLFTEVGEREMKDMLQASATGGVGGADKINLEQLGALLGELRANAWVVHLLPQKLSPHHVAFLLCHYLKSMNECILTDLTLAEWLQAAGDDSDRQAKLRRLVNMLPVVNYASLRRFVIYLANQSIQGPLSISLCKSLIFTKHNAIVRIPLQTARTLLNALIDDYLVLFEVSQEEIEKEEQIKRVAQLIITQSREVGDSGVTTITSMMSTLMTTVVAPHSTAALNNFGIVSSSSRCGGGPLTREVSVLIIGIRVYQPSGEMTTINIHLNQKTSGADVLEMILVERSNPKGLPLNRAAFGLFELVCHCHLERLIAPSEKILPIVLSWSNWQPVWSAEAALEVRLRESIFRHQSPNEASADALSSSPSNSSKIAPMLMSVIRYAAPTYARPHKRVLVELCAPVMTLFCRSTNTVVAKWNLASSIRWYVGLETSGIVHNRSVDVSTNSTSESTTALESSEIVLSPAITIVEQPHGQTSVVAGKERLNFGHTLLFNTDAELNQWIRAILEVSSAYKE